MQEEMSMEGEKMNETVNRERDEQNMSNGLAAEEAVISIHKLEKKFKGFRLHIPELHIPKGFATALIGENGAGKSTLINVLAGVRLDYKGEINYFQVETDNARIRERVAYTGTGNYFLPHWTVEQVGEVSEILFDSFSMEKYHHLCQELGIEPETGKKKKDKGISKLSDGMRTKVMLAGAFARDSSMLLMDEPASPLDPLMRDKLCDMIRNYLEEGEGERSVFFSTHNIADMENVTDYAIIMEQGTVVEQGFVEDLKEKYVLVKGESAHARTAEGILFSFQQNTYGFEGLCLADRVERLAGMDVSMERPTLSQISVAVMKKYSVLQMGKAV